MAKARDIAGGGQEEALPGGGEEQDGGMYVVEAGGKEVELSLEQLLELARLCLEAGAEGGEGGGESRIPELDEFVKSYPDVREFPPEVEEAIRQGKSPLEAYREYENGQLKKRLRALEQNESNRRSSIGSARGAAGADDELDGLMAVYNSVFK